MIGDIEGNAGSIDYSLYDNPRAEGLGGSGRGGSGASSSNNS